MTVLSALQSAAIRLVGKRPTTIFSTTNQLEMELGDLATETAIDIAKRHDWQALTKPTTITGDGETIAFPLPADYDRMPVKADVHSVGLQWWRYMPVRDLDEWLDIQNFSSLPGYWIILEGQMQIYPAPGTGTQAEYYYISNGIAAAGNGAPKSEFNADDDTFALDDRLLTLGVIWRWRAQKRLEYAEDMANFEQALAQEIGRDRGSRIFAVGTPRMAGNVRTAYPGPLGVY